MTQNRILDVLVAEGKRLFNAPSELVRFTQVDGADQLLNDLDAHPHAFLIACIMDRQMRAEKAWLIPFRLVEKLGDFAFSTLSRLTLQEVTTLMTEPEPLHRYPAEMSNNLYSAIGRISRKYSGNAAAIWSGRPSSAEVVARFLGFRGAGPKIATMATNILARDFKIPLSDYYSIDVSTDVQVCRVFCRLGLIEADASREVLIYRARALYPEFPGLLDFPCWQIGRNWCRPQMRRCSECYMREVCPSAPQGTALPDHDSDGIRAVH